MTSKNGGDENKKQHKKLQFCRLSNKNAFEYRTR